MVLAILIIISTFVLWILLCFAFKPTGWLVSKLWKDVTDTMSEDTEKENNKKENKHE